MPSVEGKGQSAAFCGGHRSHSSQISPYCCPIPRHSTSNMCTAMRKQAFGKIGPFSSPHFPGEGTTWNDSFRSATSLLLCPASLYQGACQVRLSRWCGEDQECLLAMHMARHVHLVHLLWFWAQLSNSSKSISRENPKLTTSSSSNHLAGAAFRSWVLCVCSEMHSWLQKSPEKRLCAPPAEMIFRKVLSHPHHAPVWAHSKEQFCLCCRSLLVNQVWHSNCSGGFIKWSGARGRGDSLWTPESRYSWLKRMTHSSEC